MITQTYTVTFPDVLRPKYYNEALEALIKKFPKYKVEREDNFYDDNVYTTTGFNVVGVESLQEAKQVFLSMKDHFLNEGYYQLDDDNIRELVNYCEGL